MNEKEGFIWHAPTLGKTALIDLLQDRFPTPDPVTPDSEKARYITERVDGLEFWYFQHDLAGDMVLNWDVGRVFSPGLEVRWRKLSSEVYDVLVLAEENLTLGEGFSPVGDEWLVTRTSPRKTSLYLWGEHLPEWKETWRGQANHPYWIETRIPQRLHYPAVENSAGRSAVRVSGYVYRTSDGVVQFTRLAEVEDVTAKN